MTVEDLQLCANCKAALTGFEGISKCPFCSHDNKAWKTKHVIKPTEKIGTESVQMADYYITPPPKKVVESKEEEVKEEEEKGKEGRLGEVG